jgi:hypothetical protein
VRAAERSAHANAIAGAERRRGDPGDEPNGAGHEIHVRLDAERLDALD